MLRLLPSAIPASSVAAGLLLAALATPARATDVLAISSIKVDRPTLHALGVQVIVTDDDDRDATISVRVRVAGGGPAWRDAPPLFRVHPEAVPSRVILEQFAGSVFDLSPGASYEIELHARDADGPVDLIRTVFAATRPVPPADPRSPTIRNVSDAAGLRTALAAASAGDILLLAAGTYAGQSFTLSASGTVQDPIVLRGASQASVVLDGGNCAGCNILEIYGSFVHVEDMTIQNGVRAIRFQGAGTQGNVLRRVHVRDVVHGIGSQPGQLDFLICDNIVEGRLAWPLIYSDDGGLHADDQGIRVDGSGHVVCHNLISGFGDPMINFGEGGRSYDFHGNDIRDIYGDGTELDRAEGNVRCWGNRFTNVFTAISMQPIYGGPAYVLRNVVVNCADEQIKLKSVGGIVEPSGALIYHDTFVSPFLALNLQTPITQHDFAIRNCLFVGPDVTTRGYTVDWTAAIERGSFDFDGYWPDGSSWFGTVSGIRRIYPGFAAAFASGEVEGSGVLLAPPFFASGLVAPTDYRTSLAPQDVTLASTSNALDRGLRLPGVNDGFGGAGPDLGAIESGCALPIYGPRPLGWESYATLIDCSAAGASGADVRRSDEIRTLHPLSAPMADVVTRLRTSAPYILGSRPGIEDPETLVAADPTRPLVLYELSDPVLILRVTRTTTPSIRLDW